MYATDIRFTRLSTTSCKSIVLTSKASHFPRPDNDRCTCTQNLTNNVNLRPSGFSEQLTTDFHRNLKYNVCNYYCLCIILLYVLWQRTFKRKIISRGHFRPEFSRIDVRFRFFFDLHYFATLPSCRYVLTFKRITYSCNLRRMHV